MNSKNASLIVLGIVYVLFTAHMALTAPSLPERVASHFNAAGQPDGWMSRSGHLLFMACAGYVLPAFMAGLFYAARRLPASAVNIPNKDYWLAPERKDGAYDFLFRHSLWFSALIAFLMLGVNVLVTEANLTSRPLLDARALIMLMSLFAAGLLLWVVALTRRFRKP